MMISFSWRHAVILAMGLAFFQGAVAWATDEFGAMSHANEVDNQARSEATPAASPAPTGGIAEKFKDVPAEKIAVENQFAKLAADDKDEIQKLLQGKTEDMASAAGFDVKGEAPKDFTPNLSHLIHQTALVEKFRAETKAGGDIGAQEALLALKAGENDQGAFDLNKLKAAALNDPKINGIYKKAFGSSELQKLVKDVETNQLSKLTGTNRISYVDADGTKRTGFKLGSQSFSYETGKEDTYVARAKQYNDLLTNPSRTAEQNQELGTLKDFLKSSGLKAIDAKGDSLPLSGIDSSGRFVFTRTGASTEVAVPERLKPFLGEKLSGTETQSFVYDGKTKALVSNGTTIEFRGNTGYLSPPATSSDAELNSGQFYVRDNQWFARVGHAGFDDVTAKGLPVDLSAGLVDKTGFVLGADDLASRAHVVMEKKGNNWEARIDPFTVAYPQYEPPPASYFHSNGGSNGYPYSVGGNYMPSSYSQPYYGGYNGMPQYYGGMPMSSSSYSGGGGMGESC